MPDAVGVIDPLRELAKLAPEGFQKWLAANDWVRTERQLREVLGPEPFAASERVILAHSPLAVLPLPKRLRAALDASLDYLLELSEKRSEETKNRWPAIRATLLETTRDYVVDADEVMRALKRPIYREAVNVGAAPAPSPD